MNDIDPRDAIVGRVVRRAPPLDQWWETFRGSDEYLPGHPYVTLGYLAAVITGELQARRGRHLDQAFTNIEEILLEGQVDDRKELVVGLLEGLQNASLNAGLELRSVGNHLGPVTARYWTALLEVWSGQIEPKRFNELVDAGIPG